MKAMDGFGSVSERLALRGLSLFCYDTIDSTNSEAKRRACELPLPAVLVAKAQSAGRGRMGRSFYSPIDTGLYFSYLTELSDRETTVGLTAASAVAAARAIARTTGRECAIKWVNDLLLDGKKVAGILCESFGVNGRLFAVIGIGINLGTPDFPAELCEIATAVACEDREALLRAILSELAALERLVREGAWLAEYRAACAVLSREVRLIENDRQKTVVVLDILPNGALFVQCEDGSREEISGGEISLRLTQNEEK